ncbi:MAG: FtsQ-type POTRA domain-containing protein [Actinobacteria bacterium]|nr:FtsQ-type POTRA domain-containing protein [Actinomycetota bacterium]
MFLLKHRLFTVLAILLIAGLAYLLGWSNVLTIKEISYTGSPTKNSEATVKNLTNLEVGERLARIETRKIAARLQNLPWVDNADLSRNWISGKIVIAITPRLPIATFNGQLMDATGKRFELPGGYDAKLPSVFARDAKSGLAAIKLFTKLPTEFSTRTSAFTATSPENINFKITEGKRSLTVVWGSDIEIDLKLKVYKALVALPENSKIKKIDLTEPLSPIVK